jgi:ABC-type lipoprotein release transport system permease subunit
MKTIRAVLSSIAHSPGKSVLTIFTVGIGVGVLILALSMSSLFTTLIDEEMNGNENIITLMNGELNSEGEMEESRPPEFDENITDVLRNEVSGVVSVSPLVSPRWREIQVGSSMYQARSVMGVSAEYLSMMHLELALGTFFTEEDENTGTRKAVITKPPRNSSTVPREGDRIDPSAPVVRRPDASDNEEAQKPRCTPWWA